MITTPTEFTLKQGKEIFSKLEKLPEKPAEERKINLYSLIKAGYKTIEGLRAKGYSLIEISDMLKKDGVTIQATVLKTYLGRIKKELGENNTETNKAHNPETKAQRKPAKKSNKQEPTENVQHGTKKEQSETIKKQIAAKHTKPETETKGNKSKISNKKEGK